MILGICKCDVQLTMPIAIKELAAPDATNRRNAAYCCGELCKNGGEVALKYPLLSPTFVYNSCRPIAS